MAKWGYDVVVTYDGVGALKALQSEDAPKLALLDWMMPGIDGEDGVNLAKIHHPCLILMDIQMPIMDGLKATTLLKTDTKTRKIPVIALTAYAMKGDEERMRQAGCDGYITKPIRTREFLKQVTKYLQ